ncbi:uncharacterized protein LOC129952742 [Eupeodes corollae]|uniref:uncharacterized protein LOC129952742 n=1 Tax=Eupeodes corollae TaxID=290404 RepID=UPI0024930CDC|nr:uncharacterized protein LOC129952742 [Eupeodes corollae]
MSSDDANIINDINILKEVSQSRRRKIYRKRIDPFADYDDKVFFRHYRFDKSTARFIIDLVRSDITPLSNRGGAISTDVIALTAIRYLAAGSYQKDVGDCHNISQQSVSN